MDLPYDSRMYELASVASFANAQALDAGDPLLLFRDELFLPDGLIYLDGNSLGPLPRATPERVRQVVEEEWGRDLITAWNSRGWMDLPVRVGDAIGTLLGAAAGQVVVADSTSANLFKALAGALRLRPERHVILTEEGSFPTDLYIAQGLIELLGAPAELRVVETDGLVEALDDDTAALLLTHVNYLTGRMHDLESLTGAAHRSGALAIWDLAHSAGVVPLELDDWHADLAVGCGYKYLHGGPGAPAFLYVARKHHEGFRSPLSGWMGHAEPFAFVPEYRPAPGIARGMCGTPPVLGLAALECGVDLVARAGSARLRAKASALGDLFIQRLDREPGAHSLQLVSPRHAACRGGQVSYRHPDGYALVRALAERGVVADFRTPDVVRFGFAPLAVRFVDAWDAAEIVEQVVATGAWERPDLARRQRVT